MSEFKRPTIRCRLASTATAVHIRPHGHGRVAEIVAKMNAPPLAAPPPPKWTPSTEYEFIAARLPKDEAEDLIERSRAWMVANPSPPPRKPRHTQTHVIDEKVLTDLFFEYSRRGVIPPTELHAATLRKAGYPEKTVQKFLDWKKRMEDTVDERQATLDLIFCKYPTASKTKPKPKVIKAVKKKMV